MRTTQASSQLPSDVTNYGVTVQKTVTAPLMLITLYSPHGTYDARFLANYAYMMGDNQKSRSTTIAKLWFVFLAALKIW
jgi:HAE1 family hydrophobic/amphiphilic exporter-1